MNEYKQVPSTLPAPSVLSGQVVLRGHSRRCVHYRGSFIVHLKQSCMRVAITESG